MFNKTKNPYLFYVLVQNSFNQTPNYDKDDNYNMSYGQGLNYYNEELKKRIIDFSKMIKDKNMQFTSQSFELFSINNININDFVYIDPPYSDSKASYNYQWSNEKDLLVMNYLDELNNKGIKFGLSNSLCNKNLTKWIRKYNIIELKKSKYKTNNKNKKESNEIYVYN